MTARITCFAFALCALTGCSDPDDGLPDTGTDPVLDSGSTTLDGGETTTDGGGTTTDGGGTTTDGGGTILDGGGADGGGGGTGFTCSTGTLLAGHPTFDAEPGVHANEGDPLAGVEGRPLGFREVIFVGDHLVTVVGSEVWSSDLSASTPTVHRIAGNDADRALLDGACGGARFANLQDVAADAAGALYVMDQTGNAILQITDPFDPATCAVHYWAGTSVDQPDINISDPPNVGNTDGPGLSAQFALPGKMAIGPDGVLYVWDEENTAIRRIAADASHTVSTLTTIAGSTIVDGMAVLDEHLYLYQHDTSGEMSLEGIALADGAHHDVFRGRADLLDFYGSLELGGLTTDGTDLFLFFRGVIFSVTTAGAIEEVVGERRTDTGSFDTDYDFAASHPAFELQLANRAQFSTAGAAAWLTFHEDALYFIGQEHDPYVERISCSR